MSYVVISLRGHFNTQVGHMVSDPMLPRPVRNGERLGVGVDSCVTTSEQLHDVDLGLEGPLSCQNYAWYS